MRIGKGGAVATSTATENNTLHTYNDRNGHRIYRADKKETTCARCGEPMDFVATTERKDGESDSRFKVRALHATKGKPN